MNVYSHLIQRQKNLFNKKGEIELKTRIEALEKLRDTVKKYESEILSALYTDLGKHELEAYTHEIGLTYSSIKHALKHISKWVKPEKKKNNTAQLFAKSEVHHCPYGSVLIIGAYNYPFHLTIEPLIGAIAAGNCAVLKPSEYAKATESILMKIITEAFREDYIAVVTGDHNVTSDLLDCHFDYIFFTGSVKVGKIVMEKASKNLTPVTLELGGKSPVIVDSTADIKNAAEKIVWGKLLNAGQTCIAPDYVIVHSDVAKALLTQMKHTIESFYGRDIQTNKDYGQIINKKHMERLISILENDKEKIAFGGDFDIDTRFLSPTLLYDVSLDDESMQGEIFGPILPIILYKNNYDIKRIISKNPNPLALYLFSKNRDFTEKTMKKLQFGGGCVNDTILQVASHHLPFGGIGSSGMGKYHGKYSFYTFSYEKSIVKRRFSIPFNFIYPPYGTKLNTIKRFFK